MLWAKTEERQIPLTASCPPTPAHTNCTSSGSSSHTTHPAASHHSLRPPCPYQSLPPEGARSNAGPVTLRQKGLTPTAPSCCPSSPTSPPTRDHRAQPPASFCSSPPHFCSFVHAPISTHPARVRAANFFSLQESSAHFHLLKEAFSPPWKGSPTCSLYCSMASSSAARKSRFSSSSRVT